MKKTEVRCSRRQFEIRGELRGRLVVGARLLIFSLTNVNLDHARSETYWTNREAPSDDELFAIGQEKSAFALGFG
jgi:hypothetical protein